MTLLNDTIALVLTCLLLLAPVMGTLLAFAIMFIESISRTPMARRMKHESALHATPAEGAHVLKAMSKDAAPNLAERVAKARQEVRERRQPLSH